MKYRFFHTSVILLFLISINYNLNAQKLTIENPDFFYQIASVFDFKQSIVSLTFDDASLNQFLVALPILKRKAVPATFYVITDEVDSLIKSILLQYNSKDYEIGSHTVNHHDLVKISLKEAESELLNSRKYLQDEFGINAGLTMSYPWGNYNNQIQQITKSIYIAARTTDAGYNSLNILERYALKTKSFEQRTGVAKANSWVDFAVHNKLWLVEMIHGINGIGFSPIDSNELSEHLDYIKKAEDKIWCTTVSNVIKYIDESKNTKITCELCNDTVYKIRIDDSLDDSIFNQALSIKVRVPSNWDNISLTDGTIFSIENTGENKFILFNELPYNQTITIKPGSKSPQKSETGIRLIYLSENPFFDHIRMTLEVFGNKDIDVILCDMNGRILAHQEEKSISGLMDFFFETSGINKGFYFLKVRSSNQGTIIFRKMIKV